ncbi:MAG: hypothetical protein Q9170_007419 [Blastenia crenularia]
MPINASSFKISSAILQASRHNGKRLNRPYQDPSDDEDQDGMSDHHQPSTKRQDEQQRRSQQSQRKLHQETPATQSSRGVASSFAHCIQSSLKRPTDKGAMNLGCPNSAVQLGGQEDGRYVTTVPAFVRIVEPLRPWIGRNLKIVRILECHSQGKAVDTLKGADVV